MTDYQTSNVQFWNELTAIHERSEFYDVPAFIAGKQTLKHIELSQLPDVKGKTLLHLQCHFGMDSLSWARAGAHVTGVDFSNESVDLARRLAKETGVNAQFVQSDLYELPRTLQGQFDIVFTSYGVLCWLQDLKAWAKVISHFLKDGGTFLIVEEHPLAFILDEKCSAQDVRIGYSYFDKSTLALHDQTSYADGKSRLAQPVHYEWTHTLTEIFDSLGAAGLKVESFKEYPFCMYQQFSWLSLESDGFWHGPASAVSMPLLFSLLAVKN